MQSSKNSWEVFRPPEVVGGVRAKTIKKKNQWVNFITLHFGQGKKDYESLVSICSVFLDV